MAEGPPNGGGTAHSLLGKSAIERTFRSGRAWFAWMPRGNEKKNIELLPLDGRGPPKWGGYGPFPPREKRHRAYLQIWTGLVRLDATGQRKEKYRIAALGWQSAPQMGGVRPIPS